MISGEEVTPNRVGPLDIARAMHRTVYADIPWEHLMDTRSMGLNKRHARARAHIWYAIRERSIAAGRPMSLNQIGRPWGAHHSTILYAITKYALEHKLSTLGFTSKKVLDRVARDG